MRRGLTFRQTEALVDDALGLTDPAARAALLVRRLDGPVSTPPPGPRPSRTVRGEVDWISVDIMRVRDIAARLEARLLSTPLEVFAPAAAELLQRELFVYAADLRCVARHELGPRGAGLKLDPARLHPAPQRRSPVDLDQLHIAFDNMGEHAAEFFRLMSLGPPRVWSAQARQILVLRERYATDDIDRTLDEYVAEDTARRIEETFGHVRTVPRNLTEYDRLPLTTASRSRTEETPAWPSEATQPNPSSEIADAATMTPSSPGCDDTSTSSD